VFDPAEPTLACVPKAFWIPPNLQPRDGEIVGAVFQSEKSIRGEHAESCKSRYFNSFEFFDHSVLQKHTDKEFIMN
jgi:hypothetical protein